MSEERSALTRWSQRKLAARRGDAGSAETDDAAAKIAPDHDSQASARDRQEPAAEAPRTETAEQGADGTAAADKDMPALPPIEELNAQSDYTAFLAKGVPEELTRAALRKLWTSDPVLANRDGLNIYDEDYNLVDRTITAAQTSYQPGKGYPEQIEDKLAQLDDSISDPGREHSKSPADAATHDREAKSEGVQTDDPAGEAPANAPGQVAAAEPDTASKAPEDTGT